MINKSRLLLFNILFGVLYYMVIMAKIKINKFVGKVVKQGPRKTITVPAYIDGFDVGESVEVRLLKKG